MKALFEKHYDKISELKVCERIYATRVNSDIDNNYIAIINNIISDFIKNKQHEIHKFTVR